MRLIAKNSMTRRSGFTLVDLLMVISSLIVLLLPALAAAMDGR